MNYQDIVPIIKRLEDKNIRYCLGGSGLLYFLKLIDSVNDWDITVECPKTTLLQAISDYNWVEQKSGDPPFASQYRISVPSHNIDFIGNFALQTDRGIVNFPVSKYEMREDINLSIPEIWYVAYSLMNRKSKASLLLNYLKNNKSRVNVKVVKDLIKTKGLKDEIREELRMLIQ